MPQEADPPWSVPSPRPPSRPRPHPFADRPATVAACARDYEAAADIRARLTQQRNRGH
ncbi:hypothetical protein [Streptomyces sp. NPDC047968]|uniref:hypothetical protein n=1 Tax=unclassified Streptomyces TaxID=2593676 RepID=UPI00344A2D9A